MSGERAYGGQPVPASKMIFFPGSGHSFRVCGSGRAGGGGDPGAGDVHGMTAAFGESCRPVLTVGNCTPRWMDGPWRVWGVIGSTGIPTVLRPSFGNPEGSCEGGRDRWLRRNALAQRCSARQVAEEVMAAFDAQKAEPGLGECSNEYGAGDTGRPAHAAIVTRWMPTNSNSCSGTPSTSRDSAMASRIRSVTTSSERACV